MPTSKITAATFAGAATIVAVFLLGLADIELPPEVASALTTLIAVGVGYLKTETSTA